MAKKDVSQEITKVNPEFELPDFMNGEEQLGIENLKEFVVPPFIKIVQRNASEELLKSFSGGDVILSPTNAIVAEMPRDNKGREIEGSITSFQFVPILFYPEWISWNPIEMKGQESSIRYRTVDANDPIVGKARNPKLRAEPHPNDSTGKLFIRHVEHLNFIIQLRNHALSGEAAILSFARGEWKAGSKFAGLIKLRKAPLYGCVFEATVKLRHGKFGDWYGFDVGNPAEKPWVEKDEYELFKSIHLEFDKLHKDARIQAQYDPAADGDAAATPATDEF